MANRFRLSKKPRYRDEKIKANNKTSNRHIIITAGDTSNITCCLSLFSVSSLIVPLYADRLETKKYHCLFESLSACRLFIDTLKGAKIAPFCYILYYKPSIVLNALIYASARDLFSASANILSKGSVPEKRQITNDPSSK